MSIPKSVPFLTFCAFFHFSIFHFKRHQNPSCFLAWCRVGSQGLLLVTGEAKTQQTAPHFHHLLRFCFLMILLIATQ